MQPTAVEAFRNWAVILGGLVCVALTVGLLVIVAFASQKRGRRD